MSAPFLFTPDDQIYPVYCTQCRAHIPRAVSNAGHGLCPSCIQANQAAAVASAAQAQAAQAAQAQAQQQQRHALYHTNTGMGLCPQCSSPNIVQVVDQVPNPAKNALMGAGCLLALVGVFLCFLGFLLPVGIVLMIVGACLPANKATGLSRSCRYCGHRWAV